MRASTLPVLPLLFGLSVLTVGHAREGFALFSPHKRLVAEVHQEEESLRVRLHRVEGKATVKCWEGALKQEAWANEPRVLIDERTATVIVWPQFPSQYHDVALAFLGEGKVVRAWKLAEVFSRLEDQPKKPAPAPAKPDSETGPDAEWRRMMEEESAVAASTEQERIWGRDGTLVFPEELESQPLVCLWIAGKDRWLAWNSGTGGPVSLPAAWVEALNQRTRSWATNLAANQDAILEGLRDPRGSAASFLGWTNVPVRPQEFYQTYEDLEPAYKFLTKRRMPEDKKLIQALLSAKGGVSSHGIGTDRGRHQGFIYFGASSSDRNLGDYLLAVWEGKWPADRKIEGWHTSTGAEEDYFYLGKLNGIVQFAFPPETGTLWVYLIPAEWKPGQWKQTAPAMYVDGDIGFVIESSGRRSSSPWDRPREPYQPKSEIAFSIEGILPGNYRLKAIWDRNTHTARESNPTVIPKAWQYESDESPVFTVTAGKTVEDIELACTNRALADAAAYAQDELKIQQWRGSPANRRIRRLDPSAEDEIREAVFRYVVPRLLPRLPEEPKFFFIAVGDSESPKDPGKTFLERLAHERIPVRPYSDCVADGDRQVERRTRQPGIVIYLGPLDWTDPQQVQAPVNVGGLPEEALHAVSSVMTFRDWESGEMTKPLAGLGAYVLTKRDGKWTVLGSRRASY